MGKSWLRRMLWEHSGEGHTPFVLGLLVYLVLCFLLLWFSWYASAHAATATKDAWTTCVTDTTAGYLGTPVNWTNPDRAQTYADSSLATAVNINNGVSSRWLKCTGGGFTTADVPAGSTINSITIKWRVQCSTNVRCDTYKASAVKAGSITVTTTDPATASWPDTPITEQSSSAGLWGTTWLASDIIDAGFGAAIIAVGTTNSTNRTGSVDGISVTVDFTAPTPTSTPNPTATNSATHTATATFTPKSSDGATILSRAQPRATPTPGPLAVSLR